MHSCSVLSLSAVRVALLFASQHWEPGCGTQQKVHQSLNRQNNRERRESGRQEWTVTLRFDCFEGNHDSLDYFIKISRKSFLTIDIRTGIFTESF